MRSTDTGIIDGILGYLVKPAKSWNSTETLRTLSWQGLVWQPENPAQDAKRHKK